MLVAKQFYCLFPLVCMVLHSKMMFSMVRAAPMDDFLGYGANQMNPLDLVTQRIGEDSMESYYDPAFVAILQKNADKISDNVYPMANPLASSSHPMSQDDAGNRLESMMDNPYTHEDLIELIHEIQLIPPPKRKKRRLQFAGDIFRLHNYGNKGEQVLETFFHHSPGSVEKSELKDGIPLFFIGDCSYILGWIDNHPRLIFSDNLRQTFVNEYGNIKTGLSREKIRQWAEENRLL